MEWSALTGHDLNLAAEHRTKRSERSAVHNQTAIGPHRVSAPEPAERQNCRHCNSTAGPQVSTDGTTAGRRVPAESTGQRGLVRKRGIMRHSWHAVILGNDRGRRNLVRAGHHRAALLRVVVCVPPVIRCRGLLNAGSNRNATYLYSADS